MFLEDLLKEPLKKLLSVLIEKIKRFFATKEFEQSYREWLINKYKFLNIRGIKTNAPVSIELERVFISLRTKKPVERTAVSIIESQIEGIGEEFPEQEISKRYEFLRRGEHETEKTYELKDLFDLSQRRFIIIGAPGSGKTTLLNYFALKFARKSGEELFGIEDELLPIFINLRDIIKEGFSTEANFAKKYFEYIQTIHKFPHSPPHDFFERRLEDGKCIFLLDGLDEVAKGDERIRVANWVDELASAYSKNLFIATSRPYGYESAHLYNDFLELHILDFTPEQVEQFIKYWTKTVEIKARGDESDFTQQEAEKRADDLLKAIKENPKIEVLTVNPLLLTIVSLVHRYRAALPKRRVELYEECCDVLLGYWDTAKGIAGELQPRQKRTVLQPLAFYLKNGLRDEKKEKFIELLENELPKIGVSKEKASDFLNNIKERCGVLVETRIDHFGFNHLTFQEFLTAKHILDNELEKFLLTKKKDRYWLEVTLLYCGMKDTTSLLNKILQEKEDIFHTNLFFAGRCLGESLSIFPELRNKVTEELYKIYWDESEFKLSKETALEILKEIKDQRIIQKFIDNTKDRNSDVRGRAAYALGTIQAKEALLTLIELLKDKEEDSDVRRRVANALGRMQAKEALPTLIELLKDKEEDSDVRRRAADALSRMQAKEVLPTLIELLKNKEQGRYVRGRAADALGRMQAKEMLPTLIELLKDKREDRYVRWRATYALGTMQAKEALPTLTELLKNKEEGGYMRWRAADALGRMQAKETLPTLIELLKDKKEDSFVRGGAAAALGTMQAKEALPTLIELLKDKEEDGVVRGRAADALGRMQAKEVLPALIMLLKDKEEDIDVRWRATYALGTMQAKEVLPTLIELLKDKEGDVRESAAYALGQIGDEKVVEGLKILLNDPETIVRDSAFKSLQEISERTGTIIYKD